MDMVSIGKNILEAEKNIALNNPVTGIVKDQYAGYEQMTPVERATFWKNLLIIGAAVGAKVA